VKGHLDYKDSIEDILNYIGFGRGGVVGGQESFLFDMEGRHDIHGIPSNLPTSNLNPTTTMTTEDKDKETSSMSTISRIKEEKEKNKPSEMIMGFGTEMIDAIDDLYDFEGSDIGDNSNHHINLSGLNLEDL